MNLKTKALKPIIAVCICFTVIVEATGQRSDGYKKEMDKWWQDYATYLKKIDAEQNDHVAAMLAKEMTTALIPAFGKLIKESQEWKKTHSEQELEEIKKRSASNLHAQEVEQLATSPKMLIRANKNKEFGTAYMGFTKSLAQAGKGAEN